MGFGKVAGAAAACRSFDLVEQVVPEKGKQAPGARRDKTDCRPCEGEDVCVGTWARLCPVIEVQYRQVGDAAKDQPQEPECDVSLS